MSEEYLTILPLPEGTPLAERLALDISWCAGRAVVLASEGRMDEARQFVEWVAACASRLGDIASDDQYHRQQGGRKRGKDISREAADRRDAWNRKAAEIWSRNPTLSKARVAALVAGPEVKDSQLQAIRKSITKPKVGK